MNKLIDTSIIFVKTAIFAATILLIAIQYAYAIENLITLDCSYYEADCEGLKAVDCKKKYEGIDKTEKKPSPQRIFFKDYGEYNNGLTFAGYGKEPHLLTQFQSQLITIFAQKSKDSVLPINMVYISRIDGTLLDISYDAENQLTKKVFVGHCDKKSRYEQKPIRAF